jgi:thiol-disulfide isomerase/thioredoxin
MPYKLIKSAIFILLSIIVFQGVTQTIEKKHNAVFPLLSMKGDTVFVTLNQKVTCICFFSIYCKPCLYELKFLEENKAAWEKNFNVEIVAVCNFSDMKYYKNIQSFSKKKKFSFPLYLDVNNALADFLYNSPNIEKDNNFRIFNGKNDVLRPQIYILDATGSIIAQYRGLGISNEQEINDIFKQSIVTQ